MAIIDGLPPLAPIGRRASVPGRRGGFDVAAKSSPAGDAAPAGAASDVLLGGLLALQEDEGDDSQDRRAKHRGHAILDALAGLQTSLLNDDLDSGRLRQLAALAHDVPAAADARLRDIVNDVVIRAHVELAKRGFAA